MKDTIADGIVTLGEHKWKLPEVPKNKKDIWFSDRKKEDQYWRRLPYPELVDKYKVGITEEYAAKTKLSADGKIAESISVEDTEKLIAYQDEDLKRRANGVWFMNNGVATYLTGSHYFMLQWVHMLHYTNPFTNDSFAQYREFQRDVFYFVEFVEQNPNCSGGFIGKPKKTGITQVFSSIILDKSTRFKEKEFGMMSESQKKCQETNFKYYLHGYDNMPDLLKHPYSTRNKTEMKLEYPTNTGTTTESIMKRIQANESLRNHVFAAPTKEDSFDSYVMYLAWLDEFPKYEDPYPGDVFKATKETVKIMEDKYGRLWITSYVPEKDGKNLTQAKEVWDDSSVTTIDEITKETKSGLLRYFITADNSYSGSSLPFDRYGQINVQNVIAYLEAKRKQLEGEFADLQAFKRQYPRFENEMWTTAGNTGSPFDSVRLMRRINQLGEHSTGQPLFEYGHLEWADKSRRLGKGYGHGEFGLVEFVPLTKEEIVAGKTAPIKFYNREMYPADLYNQVVIKNIRHRKTGLLTPGEEPGSIMGGDPTEYKQASHEDSESMDAMVVTTMADYQVDARAGSKITGMPYMQYLWRHANPDDFLDDVVKMLIYTGSLAYIEGNKAWLMTSLIKHGLGHFIMMRNADTKMLERWDRVRYENGLQKLPTTQHAGGLDTISDLVVCLKRKLKMPRDEGDVDYIANMKLLDLLQQLLKFDPMNTKPSDLVMAYGFAELLIETLIGMKMVTTKRYDKHKMRSVINELTHGRLGG